MSFIKLRCYLTKGFEWGAPLINRALAEWVILSAECPISPEWAYHMN